MTTYSAISDDKVIRLTTFFVFCDRAHNVLWYNNNDDDDDHDDDNNDKDNNNDDDDNDNNNNDNDYGNNKSLLQTSKVHEEIYKGPHI